MSFNTLNEIAQIYSEQVLESAVPGKPAERVGALTNIDIPQSERDAARERLLAKAKAKRAQKNEEKDPFGRPGGKHGGVKKGGGYDKGYRAMVGEIDKLDRGEEPATSRRYKEIKKESLDPVGQEDSDIDNDGDSDKTDDYLLNRRRAIGKAIAKKRRKPVKEGFSNWRQDLAEVMTDDIDSKPIKEKKINNKVKTSAMGGGLKLGEAIEDIGGTLLEMVEIEEVDLTEEINIATEYFYEQGLNEEGVDILIEELGLEGFADFVYEIAEEYTLIEARTLTGKKKSPSTGKERGISLKAAPGKTTKSAVQKYGTTRRLSSLSSPTIKKNRVAVKKAVEKQPETKTTPSQTKTGIAGKIGAALGTAVRKGMERHRAATSKLSRTKLAQTAGTVAGAVHGAGVVAHRLGKEAGKSKTGQKIKKAVGLTKEELELLEKAESEQQQKLFGLALSVKRGQTSRSEASPEVLKIVDSMSEKKIRDFAKTKHEGIPKKVEEELQPTTPQQFVAQRQLAMAQKKLTAADQIALQKKKKEMSQTQEEFVSEEDYDTMKDRHLERGGMGARSSTSSSKSSSFKPETPEERKAKMEKQRKTAQKALELVKRQTTAKYGKNSLM